MDLDGDQAAAPPPEEEEEEEDDREGEEGAAAVLDKSSGSSFMFFCDLVRETVTAELRAGAEGAGGATAAAAAFLQVQQESEARWRAPGRHAEEKAEARRLAALPPPPADGNDPGAWEAASLSLGRLRQLGSEAVLGRFAARREGELRDAVLSAVDSASKRNAKRHARQSAALRRSERSARQTRRARYELGVGGGGGSDDDEDYGNANDSDEARSLALVRALAGGGAGGRGGRSSRRTRKAVDYSYKGFDHELDDAVADADPFARRRPRRRSKGDSDDSEDDEERAKRFCKECVNSSRAQRRHPLCNTFTDPARPFPCRPSPNALSPTCSAYNPNQHGSRAARAAARLAEEEAMSAAPQGSSHGEDAAIQAAMRESLADRDDGMSSASDSSDDSMCA